VYICVVLKVIFPYLMQIHLDILVCLNLVYYSVCELMHQKYYGKTLSKNNHWTRFRAV